MGSLGGNWVEVVGDSEIVSGEVVIPAGGVIVTTDTTGEALPYMQVTVICRDVREGKIYRVLCNVETDPALIYYYAEI